MSSMRHRNSRRRGPARPGKGENGSRERSNQASSQSPLAFVFPGQGSQYVGMGRRLAENFPSAAKIFSTADELLGFSISKLCFEGPEEELRRTANAQPALLTCSIAILQVLQEKGIRPGFLAGHSLGEFSAWAAAGALSFADALQLVLRRGELMEQTALSRPGGMLAVLGMRPPDLKQLIGSVREGVLVIANLNCPGQIVVSGEESALRKLREVVLQHEGARAIPLRVSGAFHSPLMEPAAKAFRQEVMKVRIAPARLPVICNVSANPLRDPKEIREAIVAQMTSPVLWEGCVEKLARLGATAFLEAGPGEVLCGLIKRILENAQTFSADEPEKIAVLQEALQNRPANNGTGQAAAAN